MPTYLLVLGCLSRDRRKGRIRLGCIHLEVAAARSRRGVQIDRGMAGIKKLFGGVQEVFKMCCRQRRDTLSRGGCFVAGANAGDGGNSARPRVELRASSPNLIFSLRLSQRLSRAAAPSAIEASGDSVGSIGALPFDTFQNIQPSSTKLLYNYSRRCWHHA